MNGLQEWCLEASAASMQPLLSNLPRTPTGVPGNPGDMLSVISYVNPSHQKTSPVLIH